MAIREIRVKGDEILYKKCKEVTKFDKKLHILLDNKQMLRSSSQPKFKLEPIRKNNKKKIKNSNSQRVIKKMK